MRFLGYILRKGSLENLVLTEKMERSRRRRRILGEQLQEWLGEQRADRADQQGVELFYGTKDRELWRSMIAYVPR